MATDVKITPKQIDFDCIIEDVCCHPSKDILAAGSIDGDITMSVAYSSPHECFVLDTLTILHSLISVILTQYQRATICS